MKNNGTKTIPGMGITVFIILLIPMFLLFPQEAPKEILKGSAREKIRYYNQWAQYHQYKKPKTALSFAQKGLELSGKLNDLHGQGEALWNMSWANKTLGNGSKALDYAKQSLALFQKSGDKKWIARLHNHTGTIYFRLNKYESARKMFQKGLETAKANNNKRGMAESLLNIGITYSNRGQWDSALEYHLKGLKFLEQEGDKRALSSAYSSIALLYQQIKSYNRSLDYLAKAEKLKIDLDDQVGLGYVLSNTGVIYRDRKKYKKALDYFTRALNIRRTIGDKKGVASALNNIGLVHYALKNYPEALANEKQALKLREKLPDRRDTAYSHLNMANTYFGMRNHPKALEHLKKSYNIVAGIPGSDVLINQIHLGLSEVYAAQRDYKKAWDIFKLYYKGDKKMLGEKTRKQLNQLQIKYETEKKQNQILGLTKDNQLLKKDKELDQLRLSRTRITRNAFVGGFILVTIILALLFHRYLYLFAFWKKQKYVGKFRLLDKLGSGAMGTVYKAHSMASKSELAAVKLLKDELFGDETSKRRFKREAAIIDQLNHPNIVRVFERGQAGQTLYIAMEFLKGKPLDRKITEEGHFPVQRCFHIMFQATQALVFIHAQNVIHRDLKPANIMVMEQDGGYDFVKLLDFGLAKMEFEKQLTQSGNFVGTLEYISPEQLLDAETSPANDVFSLGVTFYRLLCNKSPFPGETAIDIMRHIIKSAPPPPSRFRPDIPEKLDHLVMRMMLKEPGQRPTAEVVLEILGTLNAV